MRILALCGSNRRGGSSHALLQATLQSQPDVDGQLIQVAEISVGPCELCFDRCAERPFACALGDDLGLLLDSMRSADGIIVACPFYFYVPSKFQAVLERLKELKG